MTDYIGEVQRFLGKQVGSAKEMYVSFLDMKKQEGEGPYLLSDKNLRCHPCLATMSPRHMQIVEIP